MCIALCLNSYLLLFAVRAGLGDELWRGGHADLCQRALLPGFLKLIASRKWLLAPIT